MNVWFTADTHFGHAAIMRFCPRTRPGADVEEMTELLIERWNSVVAPDDEVWHLGDFAFGPSRRWEEYFLRLNGRKHLMVGNHDSNRTIALGWETVGDLHTWKGFGTSAVLCHYPLLTWNRAHNGRWMLHGHSHGGLGIPYTTRMDVGIDAHEESRPFAYEEVLTTLERLEYQPVDHHRQESS